MKHYHKLNEFHRDCGFRLPEDPLFSIRQNNSECEHGEQTFTTDFYIILLHGQDISRNGSVNNGTGYGAVEFVKPGRLMKRSLFSRDKDGFSLLIHSDFLNDSPLKQEISSNDFFEGPLLELKKEERIIIQGLLQRIELEYLNNPDEYSRRIILAALSSLFKYLERFYKRQRIGNSSITDVFG